MTLKGCITTESLLVGSGWTNFNTLNVVDVGGVINGWCIYCGEYVPPSQARLKVFRDDGTNFIYVGQSNLETIYQSGVNSFDTNISVQAGDLIGIYPYSEGGQCRFRCSTEGTWCYKSGDIVSDSPKSSWSFADSSGRLCLNVLFGIFVNSSTGNDTNAGDSCVAGHPVRTFAKAYSLLVSGGMIRVCNSGADFSGETVTLNKSFSIDLNGASGYFYMPKAS